MNETLKEVLDEIKKRSECDWNEGPTQHTYTNCPKCGCHVTRGSFDSQRGIMWYSHTRQNDATMYKGFIGVLSIITKLHKKIQKLEVEIMNERDGNKRILKINIRVLEIRTEIDRLRKRGSRCTTCGTTDPARPFHWHNAHRCHFHDVDEDILTLTNELKTLREQL